MIRLPEMSGPRIQTRSMDVMEFSLILKPLFLLFKWSLEKEYFGNEWKKAIIPIYNKSYKQLHENYRLVLSPISVVKFLRR